MKKSPGQGTESTAYIGFGDLIKKRRETLGLDRDVVGQEIGLDGGTIGSWERGRLKTPPPASTINKLAGVLGLPVLSLLLALGYDVDCPAIENEREATLLAQFRQSPGVFQRLALGLLEEGSAGRGLGA